MNHPPLILLGTIHRDPDGDRALTALLLEHAPRCITVEIAPYAIAFRRQHAARLNERLDRLLEPVAARIERPLDVVRDDPRVEMIRETLELPFEYTAAARYGEEADVPVHPIDDDTRARDRLEALEQRLLTVDGLAAWLEGAPEFTSAGARTNTRYSLARRYLRDAGMFAYHYPAAEAEDMAARAGVMARAIEALRVALPADGELDRGGGPASAGTPTEGEGTADAGAAGDGGGGAVEVVPIGGLVHIGGWEQLVRTERIATLISRLASFSPHMRLVG
jgi:hypothetical protein